MDNLDLKCAELGGELAKLKTDKNQLVDEKVFINAVSVLEEQGLCACLLYLQAREGKVGHEITRKAKEFLSSTLGLGDNGKNLDDCPKALASDLDDLLFARDLLRQVFVYARYHAKAQVSAAEKE